MVSVNGRGCLFCQFHRAFPLPSKSPLHLLGTGCEWPFSVICFFGHAGSKTSTASITHVSSLSGIRLCKEENLTDKQDDKCLLCTKPKSLAGEQLGSTYSWYLYRDNIFPAVSCYTCSTHNGIQCTLKLTLCTESG